MKFDEQILQQITVDVCHTMLGVELVPSDLDFVICDQMAASIEIQGRVNTTIEVFAHDQLVMIFAEAMFCTECENLTEEEIRDAFGEVTNMIGGNVKAYVEDETQLTQPIVYRPDNMLVRILHGKVRTAFKCRGHQLTVILREDEASLKTHHPIAIN
jgi:chemotaxis protein CheX